jgi:hypothetical protein
LAPNDARILSTMYVALEREMSWRRLGALDGLCPHAGGTRRTLRPGIRNANFKFRILVPLLMFSAVLDLLQPLGVLPDDANRAVRDDRLYPPTPRLLCDSPEFILIFS